MTPRQPGASAALKIRMSEFFVESRNPARSHVLLHVTEPRDEQERHAKGVFFGLVEIEQGGARTIEYLNDLLIHLERFFYDEYRGERNHFEDTVVQANQMLRGFEAPPNTGIHAILAVGCGNRVQFSTHGAPGVWFVAGGGKQAHPVLDLEAIPHEHEPSSFFCELLEGNLNIQDIMIFSSTHMADYYSRDRIGKIVQGHGGPEIARHLKRAFRELESGLAFAGVVAEVAPAGDVRIPTHTGLGPQDSLDRLISGQDNTTDLLSPRVLHGLKQRLSEQWQKRPRAQGRAADARHTAQDYSPEPFLLGHFFWQVAKVSCLVLFRLSKGMLFIVWRGTVFILMIAKSSSQERQATAGRIRERARRFIAYRTQGVRSLRGRQKTLLALAASLAVALIIAGSYTLWGFYAAQYREEFNAAAADINRQLQDAQAQNIYGADAAAKTLLEQAAAAADKMRPKSAHQRALREDLLGRLAAARVQLRRELPVDASLIAAISEETLAKPRFIAKLDGDSIMAASVHTARAVLIPQDGSPSTITLPEPAYDPFTAESRTFWRAGSDLLETDANGVVTEQFSGLADAEDYAVYGGRLYVLRAADNQIVTYSPQNKSFSPYARPWITTPTIFPFNAKYLAIDGDLYVFNGKGSVQKFRRGTAINFLLAPIDPVLNDVHAVWTNQDSVFLYVLDGTMGRVVAFSKEGKLYAQYTSPALRGATDMQIDEGERSVLAINAEGIIRFSLPQKEE